MTTHFFTFGPDQRLPDGQRAGRLFVAVKADANHRALFMAWLGSNEFSSEYTGVEFANLIADGTFAGLTCAYLIQVTEM